MKTLLIRPVRPEEIPRVLFLCGEHAAYEKSDFAPDRKSAALHRALFAKPPRLWCFVAEIDDVIGGYATCTKDFSTWQAAAYLHLDCIYLLPEYRGHGIGTRFMQIIADHATSSGCATLEWQTPAWNESAVRFYESIGAIAREKIRFRWDQRRRN